MAFLNRSGRRMARQGGRFAVGAVGSDGPSPLWVALARFGPRVALSLGLTAAFFWLLSDRLSRIDGQALAAAVWQLAPGQWAQALAFTALSFWAVGRYDAVLHRHLATGVPARLARRAGIAAIAVSQMLGLGLVSGAIVRWRMLPGVSLWQATRLTAAVALSFLAGWAVVTSAVLVLTPAQPFQGWAALALAGLGLLAGLSLIGPWQARLPFRWPNGFVLSRLVGLCAIDTLAAALAFYTLLPPGTDLGFATLLPAFLLALGAGLALGTPGGMGAFELSLLALLPASHEPDLLVAILGWRLVYYVLPALLGAALAMRGTARRDPTTAPATYAPPCAGLVAEAGLRHQGALWVQDLPQQRWLTGRRGHTLIALFDPSATQTPAQIDPALAALRRLARDEGRMFAIYKCGRRLAARSRRAGYAVRRVGWEAWLDPATYRLAASARSGLRRKLRRAEGGGVTVRHIHPDLAPWPALDRLAADWAAAHGGERGFSTGRHDRSYLRYQRLYVAFQAGVPIAYVSFHTNADEWTLDLMRHGASLPDGTMHALVQAAIDDAQSLGLPRLSLAAVPEGGFGRGDLATRLLAAFAPETAATGLLRFKSAFAPRWSPRYLIAPNPAGLALAGLSLWRAITRPPPISLGRNMPQIERDDAEYGFASAPAPWHIAHDSG